MAEDGSVVIDVKLDTAKADKELARMNAKIDKLADSLNSKKARKGFLSEALKEDYAKLDAAQEKVRELKAELSIAKDANIKTDIKERLADAMEEQKRLMASTGKMQNEYDKLSDQILQGDINLKSMQEDAGVLARNIERQRPFDNMAASIESAKGKLIKFVKYAVGIRTTYVLFRKLKSAIKDAVMAFAAQDEETQATINNLKAALETLKLSWGAAFAPILNAVAPLIQRLIEWLTAAANAVARFIAIISGRSTYKKAVANNNALASSIGGVGEAAKEAQAQLMGFDELNVLQDNKSGGGGGGGAGGGAAELIEEAVDAFDGSFLSSLALSVKDVLFTWSDLNPEQIAEKIIAGLGMVLGAALGITLGMGAGGVLLMTLGGLVMGLVADSLIFDHDGVISKNEILSMIALALAALCGGVIGFFLSGGNIGGAVLGAAIGVGLLIAITGVRFGKAENAEEETKESWMEKLRKAIHFPTWQEIKDWFVQYFWEDGVKAFFRELKTLIPDFTEAKESGEALRDKIFEGLDTFGDKMSEWWDDKVKPWFTAEKWRELGKSAMESIKSGLNSISLPKFHFYWETTGYTGSFFGRTFTVNIPFPHLDWYAKGGVFDGASVIGVGEAGKEAVVPLEKNTQWINLVVDGVIERLKSSGVADQLAAAFASIPTPVMAGGTIVPPNSVGSADSMGSIADALNEIRTLLSGDGQSNTPEFRFYLDGKELHATVRKYDRQYSVAQGV